MIYVELQMKPQLNKKKFQNLCVWLFPVPPCTGLKVFLHQPLQQYMTTHWMTGMKHFGNLWDKKAAAMQRHGDGQTCGECQSLAGPHRQHRRPSRQSRKTEYHKKLNTESLKLENNAGQCRQLMQSSINSKFSHSRLYILWQEQTVWNRTSYTVSERITRMLLTITSTIINQFWQFLAQTILRKYAINYYYYTHLTASFPGQPG